MNIVLVGFMGTGKTSVGRIVAARLGWRFVDMDALIEEREERAIADIFAQDGEEYFRALERKMVRELACEKDLVIGTGGGIVLNPENIVDFARTGVVVCLRASPATILKRIEAEGHRPLLEDGKKAQRIRSILKERKDLYARVPCQLDTDNLSCPEVADAVIAIFKEKDCC